MNPWPTAPPWRGGSGGGGKSSISPIRVVDRHYQNDNGWFPWFGISCFDATHYVLAGDEGTLTSWLDVYRQAKRNVVRTLGMLSEQFWNKYAFSPRTPGYWDALHEVYVQTSRRGLNLELCMFADAQIIVPDVNERRQWLDRFADFILQHPGIWPQIVNEPWKNGWSSAVDPALLDLAERLAARLGHRNFSIGDPLDGDNPDASASTTNDLVTLSQRCNKTDIHASRKSDGAQYRRWVNHLEGFVDVLKLQRAGTALNHDEPMGAALTFQDGKRDNDPDAHVAAQMSAICCKLGYCYHYICEEVPDPTQLPGLLRMAEFIDRVPIDPSWVYVNDSWGGSPTHGYKVLGKDGKVRSLIGPGGFWTVAYGDLDFGSINWTRPPQEIIYDGRYCKVYRG